MAFIFSAPFWFTWGFSGMMSILLLAIWFLHFLKRWPLKMWVFLVALSIQAVSVGAYFFLLWTSYGGLRGEKYFLPPQNQILLTSAMHMLQPYLVGWVAALIIALVLWKIYARSKDQVAFDLTDVYWITLGCGLCSWPGLLPFLALIFAFAVLGMIFLVIIRKRSFHDRLVISPFIVPAAVISLMTNPWVLPWTHLDKIRF